MEQQLAVGRIVHYHVSNDDSEAIRSNGKGEGSFLPAIIVETWGNKTSPGAINLRVICDGPVDAWKTSVCGGDGPGQWSWPPRV